MDVMHSKMMFTPSLNGMQWKEAEKLDEERVYLTKALTEV